MYKVEFVTSAAKEFHSLEDKIKRRIAVVIDALCENPRPRGIHKLKGHERLYRIRVGLYRVIYEIDDQARLIRVTRIRHRREVYK